MVWGRWKDAERDCTTALELAAQQPSVKALYRRALARKALDDLDGAMQGRLHASSRWKVMLMHR